MTHAFYFRCTTHTAHTLAAEYTDAWLQPTIPTVLCLQCEESSLCKCAVSSQNPAKGLMQTAELVIYYKYGIKVWGGKQDFRFHDLFCFEVFYSIKPILNQAGFILNVWTIYKMFHASKYWQWMYSVSTSCTHECKSACVWACSCSYLHGLSWEQPSCVHSQQLINSRLQKTEKEQWVTLLSDVPLCCCCLSLQVVSYHACVCGLFILTCYIHCVSVLSKPSECCVCAVCVCLFIYF